MLDSFLAKHKTLLYKQREQGKGKRDSKGSNRSRTRAPKAAVVALAPATSFFLTSHKAIGKRKKEKKKKKKENNIFFFSLADESFNSPPTAQF